MVDGHNGVHGALAQFPVEVEIRRDFGPVTIQNHPPRARNVLLMDQHRSKLKTAMKTIVLVSKDFA